MKHFQFFIVVLMGFLFWGCDTEDTLTCLKTTGKIINQDIQVAAFSKIIVWERMQLIVKDAPEVKITLETGENLWEDIEIWVENGTLNARNNGACNLFRDYDVSKIIIEHPAISSIRNSSGFPVESIGVIRWDSIALISDDLVEEDFFHKDGDFRMTLDSKQVLLQCNGLSNYFISGDVQNLEINLLEGDSRLPLEDLTVQNVFINHVGTNDVILSPQQSIVGELRSTGNLILKNVPPVLEVDTFFTGRVIIDD